LMESAWQMPALKVSLLLGLWIHELAKYLSENWCPPFPDVCTRCALRMLQ
jgi:hypothetical protein